MNNLGEHTRTIALSRFTLDLDRGELLDSDAVIPLRPKSFDVLCHLALRQGKLVSQAELLAAVWGDLVVTDNSVRQCITDIRKALSDDDHSVLRTIPSRGYILEMPEPEDKGLLHESRPPDTARWRKLWLPAAGLTLLIMAAFAYRLFGTDSEIQVGAGLSHAPKNSIAVLRFVDMSPADDQDFLASGLAEEILHRLAQSPDLQVIARTSSFAVGNATIASVAQELNVAHVLEGSVRRSGNRIRVTVQLIDARTGTHLWSEIYDTELGDILMIQTEIASAVANVLDTKLNTSNENLMVDPLAHEQYLLGRHHYLRRAPGDLERAETHFMRAVTIDPEYARAWVSLAALANVRLRGVNAREEDPARRTDLRDLQRQAVENALRFGPRLPEAHMRAAAHYWFEGDRGLARQHVKIARELDPDHWLVLSLRHEDLLLAGQLEDAIEVIRETLRQDPLNKIIRDNLAATYFYAGRFDDALAEYRTIADQYPATKGTQHLASMMMQTLILLGRHDQALLLVRGMPEGQIRNHSLALLHQARGASDEAERVLAVLQSQDDGLADFLAVAEVYAFRNEPERALIWLERLTALLDCSSEAALAQAYYSPFIAGLDHHPGIGAWRLKIAQRMAHCRI